MSSPTSDTKYVRWEGSMTYKDAGFGLDTVFIVRLPLTTLVFTIYFVALLPFHTITAYSLLLLRTQSAVCL
jgi:hypothetical protein